MERSSFFKNELSYQTVPDKFKNVITFHFKVIMIQKWGIVHEKHPPIWARLNLNWFKIFNISLLSYSQYATLLQRGKFNYLFGSMRQNNYANIPNPFSIMFLKSFCLRDRGETTWKWGSADFVWNWYTMLVCGLA